MDNYGPNDWRSYLAHSLELKHSWGKKPEQKAKEKAYNHEYWEKNKERIMAQRKKHGDKDYSGKYFEKNGEDGKTTSSDNADIQTELSALEDLIKSNAALGGYDNAAMENIRQHNQNIIDNITALTKNVNEYIAAHPDMSADQRKQVMESFQTQVNKAMDMAIDLKKDSSKGYLSDIGINPNGSGGKKSSGGGSGSGSGSSSGESKSKTNSGNKALSSQAKAYEQERYSNASSQKAASRNKALSAQAKAYNQEHGADERRRPKYAR